MFLLETLYCRQSQLSESAYQNRIIFSYCILPSVMAGWTGCTDDWWVCPPGPQNRLQKLPLWNTEMENKAQYFYFALWLVPDNVSLLQMGWLLAFVGIGVEEAIAGLFFVSYHHCWTVIRLCRHEGPQTSTGSQKTWPKIHRHEWKTPFRIRPSGMTAPGVVQ